MPQKLNTKKTKTKTKRTKKTLVKKPTVPNEKTTVSKLADEYADLTPEQRSLMVDALGRAENIFVRKSRWPKKGSECQWAPSQTMSIGDVKPELPGPLRDLEFDSRERAIKDTEMMLSAPPPTKDFALPPLVHQILNTSIAKIGGFDTEAFAKKVGVAVPGTYLVEVDFDGSVTEAHKLTPKPPEPVVDVKAEDILPDIEIVEEPLAKAPEEVPNLDQERFIKKLEELSKKQNPFVRFKNWLAGK